MPLNLTTPEAANKTKTGVSIIAILHNLETNTMTRKYVFTYDDGSKSDVMIDTDSDYTDGDGNAVTDYTDQVTANLQLYVDSKAYHYNRLKAKLGITGTIV